MTTNYKVIIEFNGLPGTGKSTIANRLQSDLEEDGYATYLIYRKHPRLLSMFFLLFDYRAWLIFFRSLCLMRSIKSNEIKQKIRRAKLFVVFYEMYNDFLKYSNSGVLIMDQGILQNVISSIHLDKEININKVRDLLEVYRNSRITFLRIDCNLDIEIASNRINKRTHGESRVDLLDENERVKILIQQANLFKVVRDCFSVYYSACQSFSIDTKCSVEENTEKIVSIIKSHFV